MKNEVGSDVYYDLIIDAASLIEIGFLILILVWAEFSKIFIFIHYCRLLRQVIILKKWFKV